MLDFLFRRLTAESRRGSQLFDTATDLAREPHWYIEGEVPDTLDGRFAVLSTVIALILVRLEQDGAAGDAVSVALTERFIEVMESEHRELGMGDPTLGRTVRKLVGSLARRTELWRSAVRGDIDWATAARESLHKDNASTESAGHGANALRRLSTRLGGAGLAELERGKL